MRKALQIGCVLLAAGAAWVLYETKLGNPPPAVENDATSADPVYAAIQLSGARTDLLYDATSIPAFLSSEKLTDRLTARVDLGFLKQYEGSHTAEEFRSQRGAPSYSLKTRWLIPHGGLPQAALRIQKNPENDEYEIRGVELMLPESSFGVTYENDPDRQEQKTFLHFRTDF